MRNSLSMAMTTATIALAVAIPAAAQDKDDPLAALGAKLPGTLINDPTNLRWSVTGDAKVNSVRDASIPGGGAALHVMVLAANASPWKVQGSIPLTKAVVAGQNVVIGFFARAINADTPDGKGRITVRFQQDSAPYPGFGDKTLPIAKDWQYYQVTARADRAIVQGDGIVSLQLAGAKQTLEIGQAIVLSGATSITAASKDDGLPTSLKGKGDLINDPAKRDWTAYGPTLTGSALKVGLPGGTATRYKITAAQPNAYDSGVTIPVAGSIHKGDALIVAIVLRGQPGVDGKNAVGIRMQKEGDGYPGFGDHQLPVATDWKLLQVPMQADIDIPAGQASISLHLGGAAQTIDVGPVYVLRTSAS